MLWKSLPSAILRSTPRIHGGPGINLVRTMSSVNPKENPSRTTETEATIKDESTKTVAKKGKLRSLIDFLIPGKTLPRKAAITATTTGIIAALFSQGLVHLDEEALIVAAFYLTTRGLYVKLWDPLVSMIDAGIAEERHRLAKHRVDEIDHLRTAIAELEEFRNYADVHEALFNIRAENIKLEEELVELVEQNRHLSSIKAQLDDAARKLEERKRLEHQQHVDSIIQGVMSKLKEEQIQERLMSKALTDLRVLAASGNLNKLPQFQHL